MARFNAPSTPPFHHRTDAVRDETAECSGLGGSQTAPTTGRSFRRFHGQLRHSYHQKKHTVRNHLMLRRLGVGLLFAFWGWCVACIVLPVDTTCRPCGEQIACGDTFLCVAGRCQSREQEPTDCTLWEATADAAEHNTPDEAPQETPQETHLEP